MRVTYRSELNCHSESVLGNGGRTLSRHEWLSKRRLEYAQRFRDRLHTDPEFAATKLEQWLLADDGKWWTRRELLFKHNIKRADVLTLAIRTLRRRKVIEVRMYRKPHGGHMAMLVRAAPVMGI